jgi:hypothetical protein
LHHGNLMVSKRLAHDVEAARERRVAECLPSRALGLDRGNERFLGIDQLALRLGECRRKLRDRLASSKVPSVLASRVRICGPGVRVRERQQDRPGIQK